MLKASARIDELLKTAAALGQPAIALTDHGNMFGILEFYMVAKDLKKKKGLDIKALLGCHLYVDDESLGGVVPSRDEGQMHRITVIAENDQGYRNLVKLVSWRFESPDRWAPIPLISLACLKEFGAGLIALTGEFHSRLGSDILQKRDQQAKRWLSSLCEIFDDTHLYLTLQDHSIPEQGPLNAALRQYSKELNRPLVVTQNVHYIKVEDATAHKALLCIGEVRKLFEYESKALLTARLEKIMKI